MKVRTAAAGTIVAALLLAGCSATSRHKFLTTVFDGVPPLESPDEKGAGKAGATTAPGAPRPAVGSQHGPYAARLCDACHNQANVNGLVLPKNQLCFKCHDLKLDETYVHGPLASGGCLVCHDPHSSRYRDLLVSASDRFCLSCHDPAVVSKIDGHADLDVNCTACHDAHQSNEKYLLK